MAYSTITTRQSQTHLESALLGLPVPVSLLESDCDRVCFKNLWPPNGWGYVLVYPCVPSP